MIGAIVTIAALALAPATEASGRSTLQFKKKETVVHSSSAKCKAVAKSHSFKASQDAHVSAVTSTFKFACSESLNNERWSYSVYKKWVDSYEEWGAGFAFAKAIAVAKTTCTSSGNAYGCAGAYALAQAWAKATVSAHASAWSAAIASCWCDGKEQVAESYADAAAYEFKELVAKVEATASAHVCVVGNDYQTDSQAETCLQDIYARLFASSISKAVIKGKCIQGWDHEAWAKFEAIAVAEADVIIEIDETEGCVPYVHKG